MVLGLERDGEEEVGLRGERGVVLVCLGGGRVVGLWEGRGWWWGRGRRAGLLEIAEAGDEIGDAGWLVAGLASGWGCGGGEGREGGFPAFLDDRAQDGEEGFDQAGIAVEARQDGEDGFDQVVQVRHQRRSAQLDHHHQDQGGLGADLEGVEFQRHRVNEVVCVRDDQRARGGIAAGARDLVEACDCVVLQGCVGGPHPFEDRVEGVDEFGPEIFFLVVGLEGEDFEG